MDGHSHLDRQVRQRGDCPGCDLFWDRQEARLAVARPTISLTKQLDRMSDKPRRPTGQYCTAIFDGPVGGDPAATHTCRLPARHKLPHLCPLCDEAWR